jgi:hypothetical protein
MADSRFRLVVEEYVRACIAQELGQAFRAAPVRLLDGGVFDCDAVSADDKILACICTNAGLTISGRCAAPKLHKVRSDVLFLLRAHADRRMIVLTDEAMYDLCRRQILKGRMPAEIEFTFIAVPPVLQAQLRRSHEQAALEVTPGKTVTTISLEKEARTNGTTRRVTPPPRP